MLSCRFKVLEDGFTWIFIGVYGPTVYGIRKELWRGLGAIRGLWDDPWCIGGDFNMIRFPIEWNSDGRITNSMRRFA